MKSLTGIYLMSSIYSLAGSFVGVFVPIYFLSRNIPLSDVIWFYVIYALGVFVFSFVANRIAHAVGLRKTVLIGFPFLFLYFFLLYTFDQLKTPLYIIAIINGFQASLYWFPLHIWLANVSTTKTMGNELGKFFAFSKAIGIAAPVVAAFITISFGFQALFAFSAFIYAVSALPLFFLPDIACTTKLRLSSALQLMQRYWRYAAVDIFENLREDAESIIMPIFIYLSFKSVLSVGFIGTLGAIGGALFIWLVGSFTDKTDKKKLLWFGTIIMAALWIMRLFAVSPLTFYIFALCAGFFEALILIPLNKTVYTIAKAEGESTFILFREVLVAVGRSILYIVTFMTLVNLRNIFILVALASIGMLWLSKKNLEIRNS